MSGIFDLLLAPSTRLMGRLRFSQKLALMGTVFLVAILILSSLVVIQTNKDINSSKSERLGLTAVPSLGSLLEAIDSRRSVLVKIQAKDKTQQDALQAATAKINDALGAIAKWSAGPGHKFSMDGDVKVLNDQWVALRDGPAQPAEAALAAQDAVEDATILLFETLADRSGMTLDPVLGPFYLVDSALFRLPLIAGRSAHLRDRGAGVVNDGVLYTDDRSELTQLNYTVDRESAHLSRNLNKVFDALPSIKTELGPKFAAFDAAEVALDQATTTGILEASSIIMPAADYRAAGDAATQAAFALLNGAADSLDHQLASRILALGVKRLFIISSCIAAILTALYLSAGFTRSLRDSLRAIGKAAEDMAAGNFPASVGVATHDEMREVAGGMETIASTLRRFAKAQSEIYDRHEQGAISYRIPAQEFHGAYAEMAEAVNRLAGAHIGMTETVVGVIGKYAKGDLATKLAGMPGEKAKISNAVDSVREQLIAVRDEILSLSESAARGEFDRRGDASKFEFAYREMVEALNRLMANAEGGLSDVGKLLAALARGDLTQRMDGEFQGQFALLKADANTTVEQLASIVRSIKSSSGSIDTAAKEIASGNADLSARTEQQAASLEETASSMEELTATVKHNADNARQANQLAIGAGEVAVKGGDIVNQVVGTMGGISASSKRIADIVGVIDGIAFQTNILALNAAVEAARAGEQGRGFAVVASEVRSLAQRSANAAKEIKGLINESVERVTNGSVLVEQAGKTMGEIVDSVKRVTDIMAEITAASAEQSAGIQQVNKTVTQMDEATQQNAALVEEASASARSMEEQASALWQAVETFKLDESSVSRVVIAETRRPSGSNVAPLLEQRKPKSPMRPKSAARAQEAVATENGAWAEF